jgi:regulator of RNase E activity RraA
MAEPDSSVLNRLVKRLAALETGQISDVLDEAGLPNQAVSSSLVALRPGVKMAGLAACVSGEPVIPVSHEVRALPADTLEDVCGPDTILVIGTGGYDAATVMGGFVAYSLMREGCRGVLTDGAIRDAAEIAELGLQVIHCSINPVNSGRRWRLSKRDIPVALPGQSGAPVTINPGDLVLGDADGVVVIPAAVAEQVIADTEELARIEQRIRVQLRAGGRRVGVMAANPRFQHIRKANVV